MWVLVPLGAITVSLSLGAALWFTSLASSKRTTRLIDNAEIKRWLREDSLNSDEFLAALYRAMERLGRELNGPRRSVSTPDRHESRLSPFWQRVLSRPTPPLDDDDYEYERQREEDDYYRDMEEREEWERIRELELVEDD